MTLPLNARVEGSSERLSGTATGHMDGAGELQLQSTAGSRCTGTFVYVTRREGSGTLDCSDGRSGAFNFVSTGSRGTGTGRLDGVPITFLFGR